MEEVNNLFPLIYNWFHFRGLLELELLFRGTRDGFTLPAFHEKLDGNNQLIFFVKSAEHNRVFGGYTALPWTTPKTDALFYYDFQAWIFSLTKRTKHLPVLGGDVNAVQHFSKDSLFAFGWGDFGVKENCDQHYENWSNYGVTKFTKHSFTLPLSVEPNTN
jgi:TLD